MTEVIKGEKLIKELHSRDALTDSIRLQNITEEGSASSDFLIEGVLHAGGSCICYRATRFYENGEMAETGTLKEFYPVDDYNDAELSYNLKRRDIDDGETANQLYSKGLTSDNFIRVREEFFSAYKKISELKFDDSDYDNFFAPTTIYKGIAKEEDGSDNYTIYIWNPGDNAMVSFDDYLKAIQEEISEKLESPSGSPDLFLAENLRNILRSIKALAVGVEKLHLDNLLHLDIKPSNFGIRMLRENDGDHITVSLFDVNTIYSRSNPLARTGGTPGFRAPEINGEWENNYNMLDIGVKSDIYSLGATLYNSIVVLSKDKRSVYDIKNFEQIDTDISHSLLIEPSEFNSKADLHDILVTILKRSLARKSSDYLNVDNYISVGEFIEDLIKADDIITKQIVEARENGLDKKVITQVVDKETYYHDKIDTGATGAMQCLLYDKPLYDYANKNGKVNVLVLGAGVYSQKFLDIAFEMSQIKDCYLDVTVITNEKEKDETRYLSTRPEFHNYFWVNGNKPELDDYGCITFLNVKNSFKSEMPGFSGSVDNALIVEDTIEEYEKSFSYVFISLVDQHLNKKVAEDLALSDIVKVSDETNKAVINFVWYGKDEEKDKKNKSPEFEEKHLNIVNKALASNIILTPALTRDTLVNHKDYNFIKRMAFNCHLIWCDNLGDIKKNYGQFRSTYNFSSSLSMALSCKYKLKSIGLSLDDVTNEKVKNERNKLLDKLTRDYRDKIGIGLTYSQKTDEQKNNLKNLTMYEHRRWNVNAICSSYTTLNEDEYEILKTDNKDKKNRKHPCLVPCGDSWALNTKGWEKFSKWDEPDIENTTDFKELDRLDRMSVMLHRHFMKLSRNFSFEKLENDAGIIRRYLYNNPEALAAFNAYLISMRTVKSRKRRNDTAQEIYRHCKDVLNKILKDDSLPNSEEIKKRLENIETAFAPVRYAYDYTDYKSKDQRIINGLPFILNYSTSTRICTPFIEASSDNNNWFENVASSLVINPSILTYLVNISDYKNIVSSIKDALFNVTQVMDNHELQTKISLIIYTKVENGEISDKVKEEIKKELTEISSRIYNVEIVETKNQKELVSRIRSTLETNLKSSSSFTAIELKDDFISGIINAIGNTLIKTYRFDSANKSFLTDEGYIWFSDMPFNSHLNIEDMFVAHGRLSVYEEPELHRDYKKIWDNCYSDANLWTRANKTMAWKLLCAAFKSHIEETDLIATIDIRKNSEQKNWPDEEVSIFTPAFCKASLEKIFEHLKLPKVNLISQDSLVSEYTSTTVKIAFRSSQFTQNAILKILQNPYWLADSSKIKLISAGDGKYVHIMFDSLIVNGLSWTVMKDFFKSKNKEYLFNQAKNIFEYLVKEGYIIKNGAATNNDELSFCFPSSQIKSLLTNEGQLLEIYSYYRTLDEGYYDEVKTGLEVQKQKEDKSGYIPTQEFDMIAIKGFKTQFIEIKARGNLEQGFYQKLESNGHKFGINKKLTLVSDFGDYSKPQIKELNTEAIAKGKEDYRVDTIYEIKDINRIGKVLAEFSKK